MKKAQEPSRRLFVWLDAIDLEHGVSAPRGAQRSISGSARLPLALAIEVTRDDHKPRRIPMAGRMSHEPRPRKALGTSPPKLARLTQCSRICGTI
jgi:hypothetical protein